MFPPLLALQPKTALQLLQCVPLPLLLLLLLLLLMMMTTMIMHASTSRVINVLRMRLHTIFQLTLRRYRYDRLDGAM
jgi:hypothetical protein